MIAERWSVVVACPSCGAACVPVTVGNDRPNHLVPNLATSRIVACSACAAEFMLSVELAPLRTTKTNAGCMTAPKPRVAPAGRSIYEDTRRTA